jgi:phenylacetate-CoA ligase
MSILQRVYRHLVLPFYEGTLKGRSTFDVLAKLELSQWLPPEVLAKHQLDALGKLLRHAQRHCPYYRQQWYQLGLNARTVDAFDAFRDWPVIDRDTIRDHRMAMRATLPGLRLISKATGGSSGRPLQFDLDFRSHDRRVAASLRGYGWAGAAPGTKQFNLWGVPLGSSWRQRCKDRLYACLYRQRTINSFALSERAAPDIFRSLQRYRPDVIVAYTSALYTFARMIAERRLKPFAPKSIIVGAEKLHPFQREFIEEVFEAPVFETYGCREFMLIGAECERRQGLHLTMENLLVEILDDDGRPAAPGAEGNVVVTDLFNYGMPFIRYANGDRAVAGWGKCSCGRGLPLLRRVVGRRLDVLHTPDGRRVPGEFFPHLLKDHAAVKSFQVVQDAPDRIELRVVADGRLTHETRRQILTEIRQVLGDAVRFDLLLVDDIPLTASGKLQVVVNRCAKEPVGACALI